MLIYFYNFNVWVGVLNQNAQKFEPNANAGHLRTGKKYLALG